MSESKLRDEFEKAYWKKFPARYALEYPSSINVANWAAQWAFEKAAKTVCYHPDDFPRYKDCCDGKDMIIKMIKELKNE